MTDLHIFADVAISPEELFPGDYEIEEEYTEVPTEEPAQESTAREVSQSSVADKPETVTGTLQNASKPSAAQESSISGSLITALAIIIPLLLAALVAVIAIAVAKKKKAQPTKAAVPSENESPEGQ